MKKSFLVLTTVAALSIALAGCGSSKQSSPADTNQNTNNTSSATPASGNEQVVKVTASDFKWDLDKTEVKAGQPVKFIVNSTQGVHGFAIQGTDISKTVAQGTEQSVTWTPDKPGTYTIYCAVMCGAGHGNMHTTITVK